MNWSRVSARWLLAALLASALFGGCLEGWGSHPPSENPYGGYAADITFPSGETKHVVIDQAGKSCSEVAASRSAYQTCLLATNLIPSLIPGDAYGSGELNTTPTPALDALIWRARADADPTVCSRGLLEGSFLALCESAAGDASYEYQSDGFTVRIPIGGAVPSSSPAST